MKESQIDTCVECCVRDRDFSQKKVLRCELCDRWFCERHIEPRLAFIRDLERVEHSPEIRVLYYTEMQREDGHPDFEYSRRKFTELDIAEKERSQLIDDALNGMNAYFKTKSRYKGKKTESEENIVKRVLSEATEMEPKKEMISEGRFHFEKRKVQSTNRQVHHTRIRTRMRPWYWFLSILSVTGILLFVISQYYIFALKQYGFGFELSLYSAIILGILMAIGLLYLERWWRKHMRRWWEG